ncbi:unnamed protein product [Porites lobata]|uniref:Solute carrier organic anion transporter family member n=1 Tax=Porites lobata TaxID=104759 RepID=A0ABN8NJ01_9CNID|nr:unnamed protein product [Porites lobata]
MTASRKPTQSLETIFSQSIQDINIPSIPEDKISWYGFLNARPTCLQFLNTPKWFLFFLTQYYFTQSCVITGLYPGIASTIEKRFAFSSFKIGMILSSYEIATMIVTPFISFFGGSRKKPVFCGFGLFIMGVGFFIFTFPHFISSLYQPGKYNETIHGQVFCGDNLTTSDKKAHCGESRREGNSLYYALCILGMVIGGIGNSPLYGLGVPYLDQNVKSKLSPLYMGIFVGFGGILGAAVGFALSSIFLSLFVETGVQTSLTRQDTSWVGNWWLGFTIFGGFAVFWSLWLFGFPKKLPVTQTRRAESTSPIDADLVTTDAAESYTRLLDFPKATKLVFSRLPFVFITIGGCTESLIATSIAAFGPKILESQYYVPAGRAALLFGLVTMSVALFGNMLGAYINKRLNLSLSGAAKMCFIAALISLILTSFLYIKCDAINIAGVNKPYPNSSVTFQKKAICNEACHCNEGRFEPVCGDSLTYISPCHAGCRQRNLYNETSSSYTNCSCVKSENDLIGKVGKGLCKANCEIQLSLFLLVLCSITFLTFINDVPALIVTLRGIPVGQQPLALGLQSDMVKLAGTVPGPIILGALIDKTCIFWDKTCGENGFCHEYDHRGLALVVLAVIMTCKVITTATFFLSWLFSRRDAESRHDTTNNQETHF